MEFTSCSQTQKLTSVGECLRSKNWSFGILLIGVYDGAALTNTSVVVPTLKSGHVMQRLQFWMYPKNEKVFSRRYLGTRVHSDHLDS